MKKIYVEKVGADPEVFLVDKNGEPISAEGLFGGTKHNPKPMENLPEGFFIQEDNVAAEFNIPPVSDGTQFANHILKGLSYINKTAKKKGLQLKFESALHFNPDQLNTRQAQTLGCEPDFNIWSLQVNSRPIPPPTLRTAAGHVHVSWREPDDEQKMAMVRGLDLYLGVPSILATKKNERRSLYGQAGAFRDKPYGIEYRTLDNFWLRSRDFCRHVFSMVTYTAAQINKETNLLLEDLEAHSEMIQDAINNYDRDKVLKLIDHFQIPAFPV